jgi:hypothetical protein
VQFRQFVVAVQLVQLAEHCMQVFVAEACTGVVPPDEPAGVEPVGAKK